MLPPARGPPASGSSLLGGLGNLTATHPGRKFFFPNHVPVVRVTVGFMVRFGVRVRIS